MRSLLARTTVKPGASRKNQIKRVYDALAANDVARHLDFLHMMNAADTQAANLNWTSSSFGLTAAGSPTFAAGKGYTGDGSAAALSTGFTPSTAGGKFTLDDAGFGVLITGPVSTSGLIVDMGSQGGGGNSYIGSNAATTLLSMNAATSPAAFGADGMVGLWSMIRRSSTAYDLYCGNQKIASYTEVSTNLPTGVFRYLASTSSFYTARTVAAGWGGGALTDAQLAAMANAIHADMIATNGYKKQVAVTCHGNSLTLGIDGTTGSPTTSYPTQLQTALDLTSLTSAISSKGTSGITTPNLAAELLLAKIKIPSQYPANKRILLVWELRNDMAANAIDPIPAVDHLQTYCNSARALGYDKIIVMNTIADGSGDVNFTPTDQAQVNANLLSRWATFADGHIDLAADARLSNPNNGTYYGTDKLHLIAAGYGVVASLVQAALPSFI